MKVLVRCYIQVFSSTSKIELEVLSYAINDIQFLINTFIPIYNALKVLLNFIQPNAPNLMGEY